MRTLPFRMIQESELEKWRADTFWTKEPETIAWIDTFKSGETLFDVGANIGIYSLYAASRGINVHSFEPVLSNYIRLSHNRRMNRYSNMHPWHVAISDRNHGAVLWCDNIEIGATGGQLGERGNSKWDFHVPAFSLDGACIFFDATPDHIKIDVDGGEDSILRGMTCLLEYRKFKSMLIEVPIPSATVVCLLASKGYELSDLNSVQPHSRDRREREGIDVENLIFQRRER